MQRPLESFPAVLIEASSIGDPIDTICKSDEFKVLEGYFSDYPPNSLLYNGGIARAFIYLLIRSVRLERVVEIGTYMAGTTEVIARALWANGRGHIDTVDPYGVPKVGNAIEKWTPALQSLCKAHQMNSMEFFARASLAGQTYDLIFVDGDHDLDVALFDIQRSAGLLRPGGFLLIDNADQPGVRSAALRFIRENPHWPVLGSNAKAMIQQPATVSLESAIMSVPNTGFWLLRSPEVIDVTDRLVCAPNATYTDIELHGLHFALAPGSNPPQAGTINCKTYLRAFPAVSGNGLYPIELSTSCEIEVSTLQFSDHEITLRFPAPISDLAKFPRFDEYNRSLLVETYITYVPNSPSSPERLLLAGMPTPFMDHS